MRRRSRSPNDRVIKYGSQKNYSNSYRNGPSYGGPLDRNNGPKWKVEDPDIDTDAELINNNYTSSYPSQWKNSNAYPNVKSENQTSSPLYRIESLPSNMIDDCNLDELMTFRTFVITKIDENVDPLVALEAYEHYRKFFEKNYIVRWFNSFKHMPVLQEKYRIDYTILSYDEHSQMSRLNASKFLSLLTSDQLTNLSFTQNVANPFVILKIAHPFYWHLGKLISKEQPFEFLTSPFWLPYDPDVDCLVWKNVPPQVSKQDIKNTLSAVKCVDGLSDITLTTSNDFRFSSKIENCLKSYRTAWIKYESEEACSEAEIKLEGATCKKFVMRLSRRTPNVTNYHVRVTPAEACDPIRMKRDLILSAHLILKLDKTYRVLELIGIHDNLSLSSFNDAIQVHPVLSDLLNVVKLTGQHVMQQLDLQLLYLRLVHNVCYYSGRRFISYREMWENVGPIYLRPFIPENDLESFFNFFDFSSHEAQVNYINASDILSALDTDNPVKSEFNEAVENDKNILDSTKLFYDSKIMDGSFEPNLNNIKHFTNASNGEITDHAKKETPVENDDDQNLDIMQEQDTDKAGGSNKDNVDHYEIKRGINSEWLRVLDERIKFLLMEKINQEEQITENSPIVQFKWEKFCQANTSEVEEDKWRCLLCSKLFRAAEFVQKHLRNKHINHLDIIISKLKDDKMKECFLSDPYKPSVVLPPPVPYLYRTINTRNGYRGSTFTKSSSNLVGFGNPSQILLRNKNTFSNTHPDNSRIMLSGYPRGTKRHYRDLDAPTNHNPLTRNTSQNIRDVIKYDDL